MTTSPRRSGALVSTISLLLTSTALTGGAISVAAAASSPGVSYAIYPIAGALDGVQPHDINENGQVVGSYQKAPDQRLPFVWQNGQQDTLPLAPDTPGYLTRGSAISVNDAGLIGGWTTKDGGTWAVTWQKQKDGSWSRHDIAETRGTTDEHGGISSVNNNGDLLLTYPAIKDGFSGEETVVMGGTDAVDPPRNTEVNEVVTAWELNDAATVVGQRLNRNTDDVRTTTWVGGTGTGLPDGPDGQPGEGLAINSAGDVLTYMNRVSADGTPIDHLDVFSADGICRTIGDLSPDRGPAGPPASDCRHDARPRPQSRAGRSHSMTMHATPATVGQAELNAARLLLARMGISRLTSLRCACPAAGAHLR